MSTNRDGFFFTIVHVTTFIIQLIRNNVKESFPIKAFVDPVLVRDINLMNNTVKYSLTNYILCCRKLVVLVSVPLRFYPVIQ